MFFGWRGRFILCATYWFRKVGDYLMILMQGLKRMHSAWGFALPEMTDARDGRSGVWWLVCLH